MQGNGNWGGGRQRGLGGGVANQTQLIQNLRDRPVTGKAIPEILGMLP